MIDKVEQIEKRFWYAEKNLEDKMIEEIKNVLL